MSCRRQYIDGPFGQIHIQTLGDGPPILLLHQSGSSSDAFQEIYPLLASAGYGVIGIDTPGYGASDPPPPPTWTIDQFAQAVSAVAAALALAPAVVVGHHTGADVAVRFAVGDPQRVRGVVLHGPHLYSPEERAKLLANPITAILPRPDGGHFAEAWAIRRAVAPGSTETKPIHRGVLDLFRAGELGVLGFAAAHRNSCEADLVVLTQPCLNLTNTGDRLYKVSQRLRDLRPDFQYAEIGGGSLDIMDEKPIAWAAEIIEFVERLGAPRL